MQRCPNCSYALVLLERRGKYKCAKCGKLYPQKQIDDKEFREYNKREKGKDKEDYERQSRLRLKGKPHKHKVSSREKQKKLTQFTAYRYAQNTEEYSKLNAKQYLKFRDKILANAQDRYERDRENILKRSKMWRTKNKEKFKEGTRRYRLKNIEATRLNQRIADWRQRQKELAIEYFKDVLCYTGR